MPERVIPPACVAAVRNTVDECIPDMDWPLAHEEAEKVARAVLDAFVAGEVSGAVEGTAQPRQEAHDVPSRPQWDELRAKGEGLCNAYGAALIEIHDLKTARDALAQRVGEVEKELASKEGMAELWRNKYNEIRGVMVEVADENVALKDALAGRKGLPSVGSPASQAPEDECPKCHGEGQYVVGDDPEAAGWVLCKVCAPAARPTGADGREG